MTKPRIRQAVRALLRDGDGNVLLVNFDWPGLGIDGGFWACPGGGVEPGEQPEDTLRRELAEELGLDRYEIRAAVWELTRIFEMEDWDGQADTTYLVTTDHFEPKPRVDLVAENVHGFRWFTRDEIDAGSVTFSPRDLADQLRILDRDGVPITPRVIEAL